MKKQDQITETLRLLGRAVPPEGLASRIEARLTMRPRHRFTKVHYVSIVAIAASIAIVTVAVNPVLRSLATQDLPLHSHWNVPRAAHAGESFGAASAVHVPATAMPVAPTPVTQGRGHTRSMVREGAALPHGVAVPAEAHILVPPAPPRNQQPSASK